MPVERVYADDLKPIERISIKDLKVGEFFRFGTKPYVLVVRSVTPSDRGIRLEYSHTNHPNNICYVDADPYTKVRKHVF